MIYPLNVHKEMRDAGKATGQDWTRFIGLLALIAAVALYFLYDFGIGILFGKRITWLAVLLSFLSIFIVGYYVFRFFIFQENEKMMEYKGQEHDTFARYVKVRKDTDNSFDIMNKKIACFEYSNGSSFSVLQLKFGGNDNLRSKNSFLLFKQIVHIIGEHGLEFRTFDLAEDFFKSSEYANYTAALNRIPDKELRYNLVHITEHMLNVSFSQSNVPTIYVQLVAQNNYKQDDLEMAIKQIMILLNKTKTAVREARFLNLKQLLEFYEQFYSMEVIDLSAMKVLEMNEEGNFDYSSVANVAELLLSNGKTLKMKNSDDKSFYKFTREVKL